MDQDSFVHTSVRPSGEKIVQVVVDVGPRPCRRLGLGHNPSFEVYSFVRTINRELFTAPSLSKAAAAPRDWV